jgi:uncharacterized protein DUF846
VFESLEDKTSVSRGESLIFWIPLFVAPLLWGLLALGAIFQPGYLSIVAVALAFCISNLIGYIRAAKSMCEPSESLIGWSERALFLSLS